MTGLREALEKRLGSLPVMTHGNGYPVQALPKAELLDLLALHPVDPPVRELPTSEELMVALHNQGAYCGNCDYDDGWKACEDCTKVLGWYAKAVLELVAGDGS